MDGRDRSYGGRETETCGQERGTQRAEKGDGGDDFDDTIGDDNGDDPIADNVEGHLDERVIMKYIIFSLLLLERSR